jgi:hypothetical protein
MLDIDKLFELAIKREKDSSMVMFHKDNIEREKYIKGLKKAYNSSNFCLYYLDQYTTNELKERLIILKKEIDKILS